jgi:hypothetical protein
MDLNSLRHSLRTHREVHSTRKAGLPRQTVPNGVLGIYRRRPHAICTQQPIQRDPRYPEFLRGICETAPVPR